MSSGTVTSDSAKTQPNLPRNQSAPKNNNAQDGLSDFETMVDEVTASVVNYSKRQPKVVAAGIFALGFIVGWKIKPW